MSDEEKCAEQIVQNLKNQQVPEMILRHTDDGTITAQEFAEQESVKSAVIGAAAACRNHDVRLDFGVHQTEITDGRTGDSLVIEVPAVGVGIAPKQGGGIKM